MVEVEPENKPKRRGGRAKGQKNRFTLAVTEAFARTFSDLGSHKGLTDWARKNKTEFYRIYAKRLPAAVELDARVDGNVTVEIVQFTQPEPK